MRDDIERCIAPGQFAAGGTIGRADDFGPQPLFLLEVLVVQLELDPHLDRWHGDVFDALTRRRPVPILQVKENVIAKILGLDESVRPILVEEHDLSQPTTLDAEPFLDVFVFRGWVHKFKSRAFQVSREFQISRECQGFGGKGFKQTLV